MSYRDYMNADQSQKPSCWGNERSYDARDQECGGCRFKHSCAASIERENRSDRGSSISPSPQRFSRSREDGVAGKYEAGQVEPNERPIERFLKDTAAGAIRGCFYEAYSFWRVYRFK